MKSKKQILEVWPQLLFQLDMYLYTRNKKINWQGDNLPGAHLILVKNYYFCNCAWIAMLYSYKELTFLFYFIISVTHVILEIATVKKGKLTNPLKAVAFSQAFQWRTKLSYNTLGTVTYISLLRFSYVATYLKNTLSSHEKKSTWQNLKMGT